MPKFYKTANDKVIAVPEDIEIVAEGIEELTPNSTDGAGEKHVPYVTVDGNKVIVRIGEVDHPMLDAHWINDVYLDTDQGFYQKSLNPSDEPVVEFVLSEDEKPIKAYEFCNLHGLWEKAL